MLEVDLSFHDMPKRKRKNKKNSFRFEDKKGMNFEFETDEEKEMRYSAHCAKPYGKGI